MEEGLIGAVIGSLLTFIAGFFTLRYNYNQLFAQTVSQNRMDWINHFREEFSIVIGTAKFVSEHTPKCPTKKDCQSCSGCKEECAQEMILEGERAKAKLLTRLNLNVVKLGNEFNEVFEKKLKALDFKSTITPTQIDDLIAISRAILEHEWYKVKKEAKGEK